MPSWSIAAKDRAFAAAFSGALSLGLLRADREIRDANYARQAVAFSRPQDGPEGRQIVSVADIEFARFAADVSYDGWGLFSGDELLASAGLEPREAKQGDRVVLDAGAVRLWLS